jgi:hypothetical protein
LTEDRNNETIDFLSDRVGEFSEQCDRFDLGFSRQLAQDLKNAGCTFGMDGWTEERGKFLNSLILEMIGRPSKVRQEQTDLVDYERSFLESWSDAFQKNAEHYRESEDDRGLALAGMVVIPIPKRTSGLQKKKKESPAKTTKGTQLACSGEHATGENKQKEQARDLCIKYQREFVRQKFKLISEWANRVTNYFLGSPSRAFRASEQTSVIADRDRQKIVYWTFVNYLMTTFTATQEAELEDLAPRLAESTLVVLKELGKDWSAALAKSTRQSETSAQSRASASQK